MGIWFLLKEHFKENMASYEESLRVH